MLSQIKTKITQHASLKTFLIRMLEKDARPRRWVRWLLQPFYIKKGRGAKIRHSVRCDLFPYNRVSIGSKSVVESFATLNNGVGELLIGERCRIGMGNVIIAPVTLGNDVHLAANVVLSGLNHNYQDAHKTIISQGITASPISIANDVWIGANSVVCAGITIGEHCIVGAGSVVTKDIPPFSVAVGNPARIVKQFDAGSGQWRSLSE